MQIKTKLVFGRKPTRLDKQRIQEAIKSGNVEVVRSPLLSGLGQEREVAGKVLKVTFNDRKKTNTTTLDVTEGELLRWWEFGTNRYNEVNYNFRNDKVIFSFF